MKILIYFKVAFKLNDDITMEINRITAAYLFMQLNFVYLIIVAFWAFLVNESEQQLWNRQKLK